MSSGASFDNNSENKYKKRSWVVANARPHAIGVRETTGEVKMRNKRQKLTLSL
jgi:hypothetical protein